MVDTSASPIVSMCHYMLVILYCSLTVCEPVSHSINALIYVL